MTTPPALVAILRHTPTEIADAIAYQARESAQGLRRQGWTGGGSGYDTGIYPGDVDSLGKLLGRCVRAHDRARAADHAAPARH